MAKPDKTDIVLKQYYKKSNKPEVNLIDCLQNKDPERIKKESNNLYAKIINRYKNGNLEDLEKFLIELGDDIERIDNIKIRTPEKIKLYYYGRISAMVDMALDVSKHEKMLKEFFLIANIDTDYIELLEAIEEANVISTENLAKKLKKENIFEIVNLYKKYKKQEHVSVDCIEEDNGEKRFFYSLTYKGRMCLNKYHNKGEYDSLKK